MGHHHKVGVKIGILGAQGLQAIRQHSQLGIAAAPNGKLLHGTLLRVMEAQLRLGRNGHHALGIGKKGLALRRDFHQPGGPPEKGYVQLVFQSLDLMGDGGLGNIHFLRGLGKAQRVGDCQKAAQLKGVHGVCSLPYRLR